MKIRTSSLVHALIGGTVVGAAVLAGQPAGDKPSTPAMPAGMDRQKMMEEYNKLMQPGKAHEGLKRAVGSWNTTARIWMDPAAKPMESSGKAVFTMVLGGKFLQQDYTGSMMNQPMTGHGLMGFDTNRKQYTMVWADSVSSAFTVASGGISPDGNTITMFGPMDEPSMGEFGKTVKWVTRWAGNDKMFFEAWEVQHGDPFKVFEVEYNRAK